MLSLSVPAVVIRKEQRLLTGITGTFGKDNRRVFGWLGMNLIQHQT